MKIVGRISRATEGSSGYDIQANELVTIQPGEIKMIHTGIYMELDKGMECQCRPRSGMGKKGIVIPNAPGTIDSDYRGECSVLLMNTTKEPYVVNVGDRIAQFVFAKVEHPNIEFVDTITSNTLRGAGGFGSTGK